MSPQGRLDSESTEASGDTASIELSEPDINAYEARTYKPRQHRHSHPMGYQTQYCKCGRRHLVDDTCTVGCKLSRKKLVKYVFLLVLSVGVSVGISFIITMHIMMNSRETDSGGSHTQKATYDGMCFNCTQLEELINSPKFWTRSDVDINRVDNKCCVNDILDVLLIFKSITDSNMTTLKRDLDRANAEIRKLYNTLYELNITMVTGVNSTTRISLPLSPDLKDTIANITQRKRSILYLKSGEINGSFIQWSTERLTSPVVQGNLELTHDNNRIAITQTGVYTIRTVVKFVHRLQRNFTEPVHVAYQVRTFPKKGDPVPIESFTRHVLFESTTTAFDGIIETITRLRKGDSLEIFLPDTHGAAFVSDALGAHRISVIEES